MVKQFYEPHPGFAGCETILPEPVRLKANELDGEYLEVEDVVQQLQEVAPDDCVVENHASHSFIGMSGGPDVPAVQPAAELRTGRRGVPGHGHALGFRARNTHGRDPHENLQMVA